MSTVPLKIKRLSTHAVLPEYHSEHASGMDLHAAIDEPVTVDVGQIVKIPSGIAISLPHGHEAQIRPRSGLASNRGLGIPNAPGTIDRDYTGELIVALVNLGRAPVVIEPKMRIAQLVVAPVARCAVQEVEELDETKRGAGGFGSTGD